MRDPRSRPDGCSATGETSKTPHKRIAAWTHRAAAALFLVLGATLPRPTPLAAQDATSEHAHDYGVGIVAFAESPAPGEELSAADTLVIHRDASAGAPVVGRFIFQLPEPFVWAYELEIAEDGVDGNALEFDYEILGLPVDSIGHDGEWVRVIYGTAGPTYRRGWVRADQKRTRLLLWPEVLPERPLFFRDPATPGTFHERPGGERTGFELELSPYSGGPAFDYRMEPLEVDGRWMRVRIVTPDDACTGESMETRERIAWIEYLDEHHRPRVWYHTRGC